MRSPIKLSLMAAIFLCMVSKGNCQTIISPPGSLTQNQVFLSMGLEPEWVATIGYTHLLGNPGKEVDFHIGGSFKFAPLIISSGAWRANLITAADWRMSEKWGTKLTANIYNAHDHNRAGVMDGLGFELRATPVHYGKKWIKGLDVGWQYTALTHIKHSAEAKDTFNDRYPENTSGIEGPKDGWYGATASRFRLGFVASRNLGDHLGLQLGIGSLISVQKQGILLGFSHGQFPFYLESSLSYQW